MTAAEQLKAATLQLSAAGIASAQLDAELLMALVLTTDRTWIKTHGEKELSKAQIEAYEGLTARRTQREPLVHLTGTREFYGLDFTITPDVLTPRVETEKMVEFAAKYSTKNGKVIDVGTGSGAIAVALAKQRPDLQITATEVSPAALAVAQRNIEAHKVKIEVFLSDLWDQIEESFDTIITNLPYLKDDADLMPEVQKEPAVALFGGADGLDLYRRFLGGISTHLNPGGYLFTECDPWQHEGLIALAAQAGLQPIEQADYFILGFIKT